MAASKCMAQSPKVGVVSATKGRQRGEVEKRRLEFRKLPRNPWLPCSLPGAFTLLVLGIASFLRLSINIPPFSSAALWNR